MSFIRSVVRYNCFCMKKGIQPKNPEIVELIKPMLAGHEWSDFTITWDVAVKPNKIIVIATIKDIAKVLEVCTMVNICTKSGIALPELSSEEDAIKQMIEAFFLEGIMTWENFKHTWNIRWDHERNRIETYLLTAPVIQDPVTEEQIQAQLDRGFKENEDLLQQAMELIERAKKPTNNKK